MNWMWSVWCFARERERDKIIRSSGQWKTKWQRKRERLGKEANRNENLKFEFSDVFGRAMSKLKALVVVVVVATWGKWKASWSSLNSIVF